MEVKLIIFILILEYILRVSENRVVRRLFGGIALNVVGKHCKKSNLMFFTHVIMTIKSKRTRLTGHIAQMRR